MKKMIYLLLTLTLVFGLASCNGNDDPEIVVPRSEQFIVGLECNYAPFNWTEDYRTPFNYPINNFEGKFADGYDVQIAKAVASSLGKVLVIEKLEWDALIPQLEAGKIDAIIAGMSPTEERKETVNFTNEYYRSKHVILLPTDSTYKNAKRLTDFNGAKVVGQQGTTYDDLIPQLVGATHQPALPTVPDILADILAGKSDATILEEPVATGIVANNPEFTYIELEEPFNVTEDQVTVAIALRLNETALVENINSILAGILEDTRFHLMEQAVARSK